MQADAKPIPGPAPLPGHRSSRRLPRHRVGDADPRLPGDVGDVRAGRLADGRLAGPVRRPAAVGRRLRRLLPSLWVLAAVFVPAMLLTGLPLSPRVLLWLFPIADPPANDWGALALSVDLVPARLPLVRARLAGGALAVPAGPAAHPARPVRSCWWRSSWASPGAAGGAARLRALLRRLAARLRPPRRHAAPARRPGAGARWRSPSPRPAAPGSSPIPVRAGTT